MPAGVIELALKDVIEDRLSTLREEKAQCAVDEQAAEKLDDQIQLIERLRESHQGRPRTRIF